MASPEETAAAVATLAERMRPVLESMLPEDEAARSSTDQCLSRWVRANDGDVDAASKGLMAYCKWYTQKPQYGAPDGVIAVAQGKGADLVPFELESQKALLVPETKDADGRPVVLVQVRKHDPSVENYDYDQLTLFVVHTIESACAAMVEPVDTLCVVFDLSEIGRANVDMKAVKRIIFLLTNMYPERLGKCFLVDAPGLFSGCWTLISPMLKENTRRKIQFVDRPAVTEMFGGDSPIISLMKDDAPAKASEGYANAADEPAKAPES